ncbi:hypothetical protein K466DRAFT_607943 [Polyporus arcularius HHB13444]|uniref:Uncharacterized protein n=1 Tax=Polyporus arcularius HHB13444 TaxID=1314778 RepID=A0A5C3NMW3_9APHY|nr:hypothetical protein K466DRAFT_607943 [Polyporus arcularius HHB13444]
MNAEDNPQPELTHYCTCDEKCGGGKAVSLNVFRRHARFRTGNAHKFIAPDLIANRSAFAAASASRAAQASGSGARRTPPPPPPAPGRPAEGSAAPVHSPPSSPPTAPSTPKRPRHGTVWSSEVLRILI